MNAERRKRGKGGVVESPRVPMADKGCVLFSSELCNRPKTGLKSLRLKRR